MLVEDPDARIPATLEELLGARLDRLDRAERDAAERGAIEGQLFHRSAVEALSEDVSSVRPAIARLTRTQGVVVLEAVISKDGSIDSLRVISGPPLLIQAALDAVKQWKYRPTMLNIDAVEVITTVTVTFTLQ